MLILAIDTTGPLCSCALYDGKDVRLMINKTDYSHLEEIAPMIGTLMESDGKRPEDLDAIAVSRGPGSFTGVRIGMATAKAVGQIWKKPLIAVPTLDSFAFGPDVRPGEIVCPLFDARRDQVYAAAFVKENGSGACCSGSEGASVIIPEAAMPLDGFMERLRAEMEQRGLESSRIVFRGDGAEKYADRLLENFEGSRLSDEAVRYQTAENCARLGAVMLAKGKLTDCYSAEPEYLREAEAEKKLREKKKDAR